jgi:hypothetical protein
MYTVTFLLIYIPAYKVPDGMEVVYDQALKLNIAEPGQPQNIVDYGMHFSVYPTVRMRLSEFTRLYAEIPVCSHKPFLHPYPAFPF